MKKKRNKQAKKKKNSASWEAPRWALWLLSWEAQVAGGVGNLASPLGLPINEGGTGVLCHWPSDALPQFRRDVPCTSKVPRGYTPGSGGFRLYADPDPPNPGLPGGTAVGRVGGGEVCAWGNMP